MRHRVPAHRRARRSCRAGQENLRARIRARSPDNFHFEQMGHAGKRQGGGSQSRRGHTHNVRANELRSNRGNFRIERRRNETPHGHRAGTLRASQPQNRNCGLEQRAPRLASKISAARKPNDAFQNSLHDADRYKSRVVRDFRDAP